jgi:hypothetical protein
MVDAVADETAQVPTAEPAVARPEVEPEVALDAEIVPDEGAPAGA